MFLEFKENVIILWFGYMINH